MYIKDSKIYVELPEGTAFDYNNRITATVTDKDNNPVKDMSVTFTDSTEKSETNLTNENGRATVPPVNIDYTDVNGYSEVDGYIVTVVNEAGAIKKAFVTHTEDNKITVELPENVKFDYASLMTATLFLCSQGVEPILNRTHPPKFFFYSFLVVIFYISFDSSFKLIETVICSSVIHFLL